METFLIISLGRFWVQMPVTGWWLGSRTLRYILPVWNIDYQPYRSLILGFFMTLITDRFLVDPRWRLLLAIGFLGAYTTFQRILMKV